MRNASLVDRLNKTLKPRINRSPWVSWDEMTKREQANYQKAEKAYRFDNDSNVSTSSNDSSTEQ